MAKTKTAIHRSNRDANIAEMGRFMFWAERHPKEAWEQAIEERGANPWMLRALRSRKGEAARAAIRAVHLDALKGAEAKVSATPAGPGRKAAQAFLKTARKRYTEVEEALRPRPHRR